MLRNVLVVCLLVGGVILAVSAAIGIVRLRDPLAAMHAATKPATLGILLFGIAALLRVADGAATSRLIVVIVLQLVTAPVGAHMLARAILGYRRRRGD
jgi:multicomponent Na+:H+ antiporter subunit G